MPETYPSPLLLAAAVTEAWLGNAHARPQPDDVPAFLVAIHSKLTALSAPPPVEAASDGAGRVEPAVSVRKSLADPEYIVSMIDGKKYRSLTRHLSSQGISPSEYRERFGLPASYSMVARGYTAARSALSKRLGLGRKKKVAEPQPEPVAPLPPVAAKPKRARKSMAEAKAAAKAHLGD